MKITKKQRTEVLMEEMSEKISLILEHTSSLRDIPPRVENIEKNMEILKDDVTALKIGQKVMQGEIHEIKNELRGVNKKLDKKVDREEFQKLERRILHSA